MIRLLFAYRALWRKRPVAAVLVTALLVAITGVADGLLSAVLQFPVWGLPLVAFVVTPVLVFRSASGGDS